MKVLCILIGILFVAVSMAYSSTVSLEREPSTGGLDDFVNEEQIGEINSPERVKRCIDARGCRMPGYPGSPYPLPRPQQPQRPRF